MTKNTQKDSIFAICELQLGYPFSDSLSKLISLTNIWGIRLIKTSSKSPLAKVRIPSKAFKEMFGEYPKDQKIYNPTEKQKLIFIKLTVKEIEAKDD